MSTRKLTIEKPCNESWAGMTQQEDGRHCAKCDKTVMDFTGMPGLSILQVLDNAQGKICGRIYPSQMAISVPRIVEHQRQPEFSLRALVLGVALSTFCTLDATAQAVPIKGNMTVEQVHRQEKQNDTIPDQYTVIAKRADLSRVDSAIVFVYFTDGLSESYTTDSLGICRFTVEKTIAGIEVFENWHSRSRQYAPNEFSATNKLVATVEVYDPPIMGEMILRTEE